MTQGDIIISRLMFFHGIADIAQLAERILGKNEVTGPIPVVGSRQSANG